MGKDRYMEGSENCVMRKLPVFGPQGAWEKNNNNNNNNK